jgi:cytochrome c oxidase assembly protein subunit 15
MVYTVMMVGVFLSNGPIAERGIACKEWPLCPNGVFGPPADSYFFEYLHRVLAVLTAAVVYATAVIVPASNKKAKLAAVIAAAIVSVQILLGFLAVATSLNPIVVASHLSTGISVLGFGLLTFWWAGVWKKYWG